MQNQTPPSHPPPPTQLPVFVYGTLLKGEKNHAEHLGGRYLRSATAICRGELYFVDNEGYPYVLPGDGEVRGELYWLKQENYDEVLKRLDELEEYSPQDEGQSVYLRRVTRVTASDGRRYEAWIYFWNEDPGLGRRIATGDFRHRDES